MKFHTFLGQWHGCEVANTGHSFKSEDCVSAFCDFVMNSNVVKLMCLEIFSVLTGGFCFSCIAWMCMASLSSFCVITILINYLVWQFNFVGRILGPRGNSLKRVEATTGCRVLIRGRGSIKDTAKVR